MKNGSGDIYTWLLDLNAATSPACQQLGMKNVVSVRLLKCVLQMRRLPPPSPVALSEPKTKRPTLMKLMRWKRGRRQIENWLKFRVSNKNQI